MPRRNTSLSPSRLVVVFAMLALAGCINGRTASRTPGVDMMATGSVGHNAATADLSAVARDYEAHPDDRSRVIAYASLLRAGGRTQEAVAVLAKAMLKMGKDHEISGLYGKALADNGQFNEALAVLQNTIDPTNPDWRLLNAEGAVFDQLGNAGQARQTYARALLIAPGAAEILNNEGLSYLLTGEAAKAEQLLRQALAAPGAPSRVRQNLALAVAMQGRLDEASRIASLGLPPDEAHQNVAALKAMVAAGGPRAGHPGG